MANEGIAKWFGLRRSNFILNPRTDAAFYATRTGVDIPSIVENLQVDLVTEVSPKRFFWGIYGGGKTHTLFKVSKELENITPIKPIYVECPNVGRNSKFLHLYHDGIMASMGQDFVVGLFEKFIEKIGLVRRDELERRIKEVIEDIELSKAIASLLGATPSKKVSFWRYLCGGKTIAKDLDELAQTEDLTEAEPTKLAGIIIAIGKVVKEVEGKNLVLILDELDRLLTVTDIASALSFQNAFRILVDPIQKDVAIIMGCTAGQLREVPEPVLGDTSERAALGPVLSKLGRHNLIEIQQLEPNDIDSFIKEVINYVREPNIDVRQRVAELKEDISETLEPDFFPITKEAIEALKAILGGNTTPREITLRMTQAAGKAYLMKKPVITRDVIG